MQSPRPPSLKPQRLSRDVRALLKRWTLAGEQPIRVTERLTQVASELSKESREQRAIELTELELPKRAMEILSRGRELQGRRPVTLPERLDGYAREVLAAKSNVTVLRSIIRRQKHELTSIHPLTTVQRALSELRKLIREKRPRSPALQLLLSVNKGGEGLTNEEVKASRARVRLNTVLNQATRRPIHDPKGLIEIAKIALSSPRWSEVAAGIILLSGRRSTEVLQSGHFTHCSPPHPHKLRFRGQLKTRNAEGTRQSYYPIDVLCSPQLLIDALPRLRQLFPTKGLSYNEVRGKLSELQKTVRGLFSEFTPKDLRAVSGRIAYHAFAPAYMDAIVYLAKQLGHKRLEAEQTESDSAADADTLTSAFYLQFYIPKLEARSRLKL